MGYIEMKHSFKSYKMGDSLIEANKDITFSVEKGELAIILGSSGAGKSTVLNILGGMDTNDKGDVIIDGRNIAGASARAHEVSSPGRRVCLSVLQPHAQPHGQGERRAGKRDRA